MPTAYYHAGCHRQRREGRKADHAGAGKRKVLMSRSTLGLRVALRVGRRRTLGPGIRALLLCAMVLCALVA